MAKGKHLRTDTSAKLGSDENLSIIGNDATGTKWCNNPAVIDRDWVRAGEAAALAVRHSAKEHRKFRFVQHVVTISHCAKTS